MDAQPSTTYACSWSVETCTNQCKLVSYAYLLLFFFTGLSWRPLSPPPSPTPTLSIPTPTLSSPKSNSSTSHCMCCCCCCCCVSAHATGLSWKQPSPPPSLIPTSSRPIPTRSGPCGTTASTGSSTRLRATLPSRRMRRASRTSTQLDPAARPTCTATRYAGLVHQADGRTRYSCLFSNRGSQIVGMFACLVCNNSWP